MAVALTDIEIIALVVCAFAGAVIYSILYGLSKYKEQQLDAAKIRKSIVESGRDPAQEDTLSAQEKWDLAKVQKFDRIFLVGMIIGIILATASAVAICWFYLYRWVGNGVAEWAAVGFILGIIAAWFYNETLVKYATAGEWADKASQAFQITVAAIEDPAAVSLLEEYAALYMKGGMSRKEALAHAKDYLAAHPELIK